MSTHTATQKPVRNSLKESDETRRDEAKHSNPSRLVPPLLRLRKLMDVAHDEFGSFHARLRLANLLLAPLPIQVGGDLRAAALRMVGFRIGRATVLYGRLCITGNGDMYERLAIGHHCQLGIGCTLDLEEHITIGNRVTLGHQVMILTSSHEIGPQACRAGPVTRAPVIIEDGAWIGPRCTILPGVTIGAGAIVAAGALVNRSVAPNTCVAGVPARSEG